MRACVYDKTGEFGMRFVAESTAPRGLDQGQVLVQVRAAALNPVDYKLANLAGWFIQKKVVAQDFAGVVLESKSSRFPVGTSVFGMCGGAICEKLVAKEEEIAVKPASLSFVQAAALPTVCLTSLQGLLLGGTTTGSKVLVSGASGGCGLSAVQIARAIVGPDGRVAGICGSANIERLQTLGVCDILADYKSPDVLLSPDSSPLRSVSPIDVFYDTVSSPDPGDGLGGKSYDQALKHLFSKDTKIVAINGSALRWIRMFLGLQEKNFKLFFTTKSGAQLEQISAWVESKALALPLDSVHPFSAEGIKAAYTKLKSRRAVGKIVIDVLSGTEI